MRHHHNSSFYHICGIVAESELLNENDSNGNNDDNRISWLSKELLFNVLQVLEELN